MIFRILNLSILVLALSACNSNPKPADTTKLVKSDFEFSGMNASLFLPSNASISTGSDSDITFIDFQPDSRNQFTISLNRQTSSTPPTGKHTKHSLKLSNGAKLNYDLTNYSEQGSGGPEASLIGNIKFENALTIEVACHIQQDVNKPDATWCIPYLHHLNIHANNQCFNK